METRIEPMSPRDWRRARGKTIEDMARELEISPTTWSKWEKKPSLIPIGVADKFCEIVNAPTELVIFL